MENKPMEPEELIRKLLAQSPKALAWFNESLSSAETFRAEAHCEALRLTAEVDYLRWQLAHLKESVGAAVEKALTDTPWRKA